MNIRTITRRVLRAQVGVARMRHLYQEARYAPVKGAGKYGGPLPTKIPTSEANAPVRRAFLAERLPAETPDGRNHREMEKERRTRHAKGGPR